MSKKLIVLISFMIVLSAALTDTVRAELVGWWRFDEGSGTTANDFSGYGNDGTLLNGAGWGIGYLSNSSVKFDGIDDFVEIPHNEILTVDNEVTVMAWINTERYIAPNGEVWQGILSKSNSPRSYSFYTREGAVLHFSTGGTGTQSTGQLPLNEWVHVAAMVVGGQHQYYINGEDAGLAGSGITLPGTADTATVVIGRSNEGVNRSFLGMIDDVRIFNHALSQQEVQTFMENEGWPYAIGPNPKDGALHEDTWVSMNWRAGDGAASHDVYFGESFNDVNDGAGDTFQGNQAETFFVVGFPGFPYPDGLVPGTTYYWRIDEVEADGTTKHKGEIWSFTVPPRKAYEPSPADGAKLVDPNADLSWTEGLGAKLQTVYFGDNFDDVNDASGGLPQATSTYDLDTLEFNKDYYWRVDSFDAVNTYKGDIWSFRTIREIRITDPNLVGWWGLDEGSGLTVIDQSGYGNHGTLKSDPQWVIGYDGYALMFDGVDDFVEIPHNAILTVDNEVTVMAWINTERHEGPPGQDYQGIVAKGNSTRSYSLYTQSAGTLHFSTTSQGAYVGSSSSTQVPLNEWVHVAAMVVDGGHVYYINGEPAGTGGGGIQLPGATDSDPVVIGRTQEGATRSFLGLIDDVRIYNRALTQDEIKQIMRGDPTLAWNPDPANGAIKDIDQVLPLSWSPGESVSQHDVYFSTDRDAADNADVSDTMGVYRGRQSAASYTPAEGVEWAGGPYYWRIDEYNTDGTVSRGKVWSFMVSDYLTVDDFESYNDLDPADPASNRIFNAWLDGYDNPAINGSVVGYANPPFAEQTIVHSGNQSMPFSYDNGVGKSEATLTLPSGRRDWTREGVSTLVIWYTGDAANAPETLYVVLNGTAGVDNGNPNAAQAEDWTEWSIDLQTFGINLTNVNTITLGFGNRTNPVAGGSGMMYFDDIRLYAPR